MNKRKQHRYTTEAEIIRCIDKWKSKAAKLRVRIATEHFSEEQILNLNKQVRRIEDSTLPNLKNALAAFNTMLLPGITDDPGVTIR